MARIVNLNDPRPAKSEDPIDQLIQRVFPTEYLQNQASLPNPPNPPGPQALPTPGLQTLARNTNTGINYPLPTGPVPGQGLDERFMQAVHDIRFGSMHKKAAGALTIGGMASQFAFPYVAEEDTLTTLAAKEAAYYAARRGIDYLAMRLGFDPVLGRLLLSGVGITSLLRGHRRAAYEGEAPSNRELFERGTKPMEDYEDEEGKEDGDGGEDLPQQMSPEQQAAYQQMRQQYADNGLSGLLPR